MLPVLSLSVAAIVAKHSGQNPFPSQWSRRPFVDPTGAYRCYEEPKYYYSFYQPLFYQTWEWPPPAPRQSPKPMVFLSRCFIGVIAGRQALVLDEDS
mmetsp:Transcript_20818/g.43620  ORF Transcript_20818/g.43620 Transcript_20818/m.43620 type:complete len:97 (-) Transcript_20818:362-652(-)